MNNRNDENLKELFEKFMSAPDAQECAEDVRKVEQILCDNPAPEPDDMLIANIKAEIAMRLPARKKYTFRQIAYRVVNVAAAIIVMTVIGMYWLNNGHNERDSNVMTASIIPAAIWDSDDITLDDENLVIFSAKIDQIEDEMRTLQYGQDSNNGEGSVTELEMELREINESDFWKG